MSHKPLTVWAAEEGNPRAGPGRDFLFPDLSALYTLTSPNYPLLPPVCPYANAHS